MGLIKHHYFKAVRSEQRKITLIAFRVLGEHDVATIQSAQTQQSAMFVGFRFFLFKQTLLTRTKHCVKDSV